jgi:uncharacterized protein YkwD
MPQYDRSASHTLVAVPLVGNLGSPKRTRAAGIVVALLVALVFCSALPALALAAPRGHAAGLRDGCANTSVLATSASAQTMRNAVVCLVNYERARYHLPPLTQVSKLTASAQSYTAEMVRDNLVSHTAPSGSTPGARITAAGYRWSWAGENIASGFTTPLSVVSAWMLSQGHCYNILAPVFSNIGVGVSPHAAATASGPATWTQDFGLPLGAHAPSGNWGPADSCH